MHSRWNEVELKLNEDALVMQTTLDILAHDTRNLFANIFALLPNLPENDVSMILHKHISELYNLISEALGYISFEKRIFSLVDMIESISLDKNRIPLASFDRIEFTYRSRKLFFIETGRVFKNVLCNVIENALKYSDEKSKVLIHLELAGNNIRIEVIDSGIGIPDEEKTRIFDRSYRLETVKGIEGSGKGLWIVKNIVNKEGGSISVEDNPGGGTVMTVTIPAFCIDSLAEGFHKLEEWYGLSTAELEQKAGVVRKILEMEFPDIKADLDSLLFANLLDQLRGEFTRQENGRVWLKLNDFKLQNPRGTSVLLADDSLYVHYKIAPTLVNNGFCITGYALNGREALNKFAQFKPEIVIMDITMPVMSGIEAAKKIFEHEPNTMFIFSTALGKDKLVLDELETVFPPKNYRVITKPFRPEELLRVISSFRKERPAKNQ
jgi:CheY-like chemotaxis protein